MSLIITSADHAESTVAMVQHFIGLNQVDAADLVARSWQLMKPDQLTDFKWTELWAMARSPAEPMF